MSGPRATERESWVVNIWPRTFVFSPLPPSPDWLQISALLHLLDALGGDEGVGMGRYLILLLIFIMTTPLKVIKVDSKQPVAVKLLRLF